MKDACVGDWSTEHGSTFWLQSCLILCFVAVAVVVIFEQHINSLKIGMLGNEEVVGSVDDDGEVRVYYVNNLDRKPVCFRLEHFFFFLLFFLELGVQTFIAATIFQRGGWLLVGKVSISQFRQTSDHLSFP